MVEIPKAVQVGPIRYSVSESDEDAKRHLYENGKLHYCGRTVHAEQLIVLDKTQGMDRGADTMVHEVLHAISCVFDVDLKEKQVAQLSAPLLDVLRRNPALVEYLAMQGQPAKTGESRKKK